jgi:hypothetical protein
MFRIFNTTVAIILIFFIECASPSRKEAEYAEFVALFPAINSQLWGNLYLYEYNQNLSGLTFQKYRDHLRLMNHANGAIVLARLDDFEEHLFEASEASFVICLKSEKKGFAVCDDAHCNLLERSTSTSPLPDLKSLSRGLPKIKCDL